MRYSVTIPNEIAQGIDAYTKLKKVSRESVLQKVLSVTLHGLEILIVGPEFKATAFLSHREALTAMAGMADWEQSLDMENRSFQARDGKWARIVRVELPR